MDDVQVAAACDEAARDPSAPGHEAARCLVSREPFKLLYRGRLDAAHGGPSRGERVLEKAVRRVGEPNVRRESRTVKNGSLRFPVRLKTGAVAESVALSTLLAQPASWRVEYLFVHPRWEGRARRSIGERRDAGAARGAGLCYTQSI